MPGAGWRTTASANPKTSCFTTGQYAALMFAFELLPVTRTSGVLLLDRPTALDIIFVSRDSDREHGPKIRNLKSATIRAIRKSVPPKGRPQFSALHGAFHLV